MGDKHAFGIVETSDQIGFDGDVYAWGEIPGSHASIDSLRKMELLSSVTPLNITMLFQDSSADMKGRHKTKSAKVIDISAGSFHSLAVRSDSQVFSWGEGAGII